MAARRSPSAAAGRSAGPVSSLSDSVCSHLALESRTSSSERIDGNVLVDVDCLCVLAKVVQSGEPSRAVALEGSLASMLSSRQLV